MISSQKLCEMDLNSQIDSSTGTNSFAPHGNESQTILYQFYNRQAPAYKAAVSM